MSRRVSGVRSVAAAVSSVLSLGVVVVVRIGEFKHHHHHHGECRDLTGKHTAGLFLVISHGAPPSCLLSVERVCSPPFYAFYFLRTGGGRLETGADEEEEVVSEGAGLEGGVRDWGA